MNTLFNSIHSKKGFTLIELLVVMSIVSLLSSIVFTNLTNAREKARVGAGKKQFTSMRSSMYDSAYVMWSFDEGGGAGPVIDFGPSGKNGSIFGAGYVAGIRGTGMNFFGADHRVATIEMVNRPAGPWTLGTWVNSTAGSGIFVSHAYPYLRITGGNFSVTWVNAANAGVTLSEVGGGRKLNTWYYVVATHTGSEVILYVDGKEVARVADNNTPARNGFFYAGLHSDWTLEFDGMLDEVYYSGRSLLASEVQNLYALGVQKHSLAER